MKSHRTPYNQTRRVMAILKILCTARGALSIENIVEKLPDYNIEPDDGGQNKRSIQRDIAFLRDEMGYKIDTLRGEGYVLHGTNEVLPIFFSKEELEALTMGRTLFSYYDGTHFGDAIESVYGKIDTIYRKNRFSEDETLEKLENQFMLHKGPRRLFVKERELLKTVTDAFKQSLTMTMIYRKSDGTTHTYQIKPHKLILYKESLYLLALPADSSASKEFRIYLVNRISSATLTEKKFKPISTIAYEKKINNSFGISSDGPLKRVIIGFDAGIAPYIAERQWHESQRIEETLHGINLIMKVYINGELANWIRSFGGKVTSIEPKEILDLVKGK